MSIERVLKEADAAGFCLNNLCELAIYSGELTKPVKKYSLWQACFKHALGWYDFGRGDNPLAALEDALAKAKAVHAKEIKTIPQNNDLDSLL